MLKHKKCKCGQKIIDRRNSQCSSCVVDELIRNINYEGLDYRRERCLKK